MGDIRNTERDSNVLALVEAILGHKIESQPGSSTQSNIDEYEDLVDMSKDHDLSKEPRPDSPPKNPCVGAVNPYALAEALIGRKIDRESMAAAQILQNVLQTDYDELFDMRHKSVLYAGMKLNEKERKAEMYDEKDMKILNERDLQTPDFSGVRRLDDLEKIGLKDIKETKVKVARMQNGKLRLVLHAHELARTVSNREVTMSINELVTPFRMREKGRWQPPNASWRDMYDYFFQQVNKRLISDITMFRVGDRRETLRNFDDPTQGCSSNSWFVSALFSVFWADPCAINRATRVHTHGNEKKRFLSIKFHDKGGKQNNRTETVEVNYEIPINNSDNEPLYCRSSDGADIWPSLYEKAFAKWITGTTSEQPDITQTHCGDPIKAMAQINGRTPHYYECNNHSAHTLLGLVRSNSLNNKTINPMTAFTYATGREFHGANIVANHAYSVLGYCVIGDKQYIVLRNPWGVTEPQGLTSYTGLLGRLDPEIWNPATLLDHGGLFALEADSFKKCFSHIGVAK
ncbi:Thiol protease [Colletotrichum siamense]|uniref:Thiol protease n=1 Tax=Colletotrichum siamense TaxID=690259 RepID=A0A9P5EU48_COLSI|nr:Thiol protease [Colletotrichum siamense]KAF4859576.1 Thiol protease [Colletotrichum siamense]